MWAERRRSLGVRRGGRCSARSYGLASRNGVCCASPTADTGPTRAARRVRGRSATGRTTRRKIGALREHLGETLWCCTPQSAAPVSPLDLRYADGEPIEPDVLEFLRAVQWNLSVAFAWRQGDVLCLDNIGCQHGRLPFAEGSGREVFVSLATPKPGTCHVPGAVAEG